MTELSDVKWSLSSALWRGVRELFPSAKGKWALWGLVGLGVAITFMELFAAQLFSNMITNIGTVPTSRSALLLVVFVLAFTGVKAIQYFQSVYRLSVFERSFRSVPMPSGASEAWRWPMALELVAVLGVIARLGVVVVTVATTQWWFGAVLLVCTVIAVAIVTRTGKRQYAIHHGFVDAKRAGRPPTPAERVRTRIRAGERAGLAATVPIVAFIAVLGVGALDGTVAPNDALLLFIAGRMAANLYGTLSTSTMRFVRSEVNVEAFSGGSLRTRSAEAETKVEAAPADTDEERLVERLVSSRALWEPPTQAVPRLVDAGDYVAGVELIGGVARERGFGQVKVGSETTTPIGRGELCASAPNQVWMVRSARAPIEGVDDERVIDVVVDAFSRAALAWQIRGPGRDARDALVARAMAEQGVESTDVVVVATEVLGGPAPTLHDLIRSLGGVARVLQWEPGRDYAHLPAPDRPEFPSVFDSAYDCERWIDGFFPWYNDVFYQPDLGYLHPSDVHAGLAEAIAAARAATMQDLESTVGAGGGDVVRAWGVPSRACVGSGVVTTERAVAGTEPRELDDDDDES